MFLLFSLKGWKPSEYYDLGKGEKKIVTAFLEEEIYLKNKELESLNKR